MKRRLIFIMVMLLSILPTFADIMLKSDTITINFRLSESELVPDFMDNEAKIQQIKNLLEKDKSNSTFTLQNVEVTGTSSPEGTAEINTRLARQRAKKTANYLVDYVQIPKSMISTEEIMRDWRGARRLVAEDPEMPMREETLRLIDEIIAGNPFNEAKITRRMENLRKLGDGIPYRYMSENHFPLLRTAQITLVYETYGDAEMSEISESIGKTDSSDNPEEPIISEISGEVMEPTVVTADDFTESSEEMPEPTPDPESTESRRFLMNIRTNMLYDAAAVPNLGVEFSLGKNLSVAANWMYAWWRNDRKHRYWRVYGGDVALRWWFGRQAHEQPLTGHHIGVYGGLLTYDFEWGGTGYMGGLPGHPLWDRFCTQAGLEYGYSLPIGRRLNIDFTLGIGYFGGEKRKYKPEGDFYKWQSTSRLTYFGPTKAEISLTWMIGRGVKARKGGAR